MIVVRAEFPHNVLQIDGVECSILGYPPVDLLGKSILKILPNDSDRTKLQWFMTSPERSAVHLKICDGIGKHRPMLVTVTSFVNEVGFICCRLDFDGTSEAITLQQALEDTSCPTMLVCAASPHRIMHVNDSLLDKFSCTRSEVLGCTLEVFKGPGPSKWDALIETALSSKVARDIVNCTLNAISETDDLICVPVVDEEEGFGGVDYILFLFAPTCTVPLSAFSAPPEHQADPLYPHDAVDFGYCSSTDGITACDSEAARAGEGDVEQTSKKTSASTRISTRGKGARMVNLTPALVSSLLHQPLRQAAASLGVSVSALKRACRRMGILRWK